MILPDKDEFIKEIEFITNEQTREDLSFIYDNLKNKKRSSVSHVYKNNDNIEIITKVKSILNDLFNPYKISNEPMIPFSFFQTLIGKVIMSAISENVDYTVTDLATMTGLTSQYINQEIKSGRLKASKDSGRWLIPAYEAERFLSYKAKKQSSSKSNT